MDLENTLQYAKHHRQRFVSEVSGLIKIPSISTSALHKKDIQRAAHWLTQKIEDIGMKSVQIIPTDRHPIVYAEWLEAGDHLPIILFYGHYDVIPAEPLEEWKSDPFDPVIVNNIIYGRGTNDDKCQLFTFIAAVEAYLKTCGTLPVNVKFLIEGAEEEGSAGMEKVLEEYRDLLKCDTAVLVDGAFMNKSTPVIGTGSRGLVYAEILVHGPARDLHSGNYGGIIHNPVQAAAEIVSKLHDGESRVAIPGFYDQVHQFSPEEVADLKEIGLDDSFYIESLGIPRLWGEKGYSVLEKLGMRPTLEIHGIGGGFSGEGQKTVIPAAAIIKLSMRIVPHQDPDEIAALLTRYIAEITPETVITKVNILSKCDPAMVDIHSPYLKLSHACYKKGYGLEPVKKRGGGSLAVIGLFQKKLGIPVLSMGLGLPDDGLHSPNEKFDLDQFYKGIDGMIYLLDEAKTISAG